MTDVMGPPLEELESAIARSDPDHAVNAGINALRAKTSALEVARTAARSAAVRTLAASGEAPRGLVVLSSALNLLATLQPHSHAWSILQAISFLASEKKSATAAKPALVVSGEITHLGRSFLFAVRAGDLSEAESIFLGMVDEGWERKMAGDMLFRAAIEDMGDGGRKLMVAINTWQLARSLGFRDARSLLRPAVQYLVKGPVERAPFGTIMTVLGKEWVDLEALSSGGRPLDDAGRAKVAALLTSETEAACVASTLDLLRSGYAAASLAEGFSVEAAKRVANASGYDLDAARSLMFAHAARFVLTFSRTSERLYALFQAALRVRSPSRAATLPSIGASPNESEELRHLAGALDARKPPDAAARVRSYLAHGYPAARLLDVLGDHACRDSAVANSGINLLLADVCGQTFLATNAPEVPMALAKMIAASPKDQAAYEGWNRELGR